MRHRGGNEGRPEQSQHNRCDGREGRTTAHSGNGSANLDVVRRRGHGRMSLGVDWTAVDERRCYSLTLKTTESVPAADARWNFTTHQPPMLNFMPSMT
jgi:hypothetical protein